MDTQCWISDDVELVSSCGAFNYPLHSHVSMLTLSCVRSGQVTFSTRSGTRHYRAGECFDIQPHVAHSLSRAADSEVVSVCCATSRVYVNGILKRSRVQSILADMQENDLLVEYEVEACKNVLKSMPSTFADSAAGDSVTRQLLVALETHPEVDVPLAALTRQCGRSLWYAIRCFRETTGLTPHQFLIQNRIRQAKRLLREQDSLTNAALSAGFYDQSHLNRCLLRSMGLTPARYRAACHNVACYGVACAGGTCGSAQRREKFGEEV